jgi:hypothetical protein
VLCCRNGTRRSNPDETERYGGLDYAVTARYVVENTPKDEELYIRVNTLEGNTHDIFAPVATWKRHPVTDVAVIPINWPEDVALDAMAIPVATMPKEKSQIVENRIIEGDEILIVGLLTHFPGSKRIQPIVGSGRISSMPHEKISCRGKPPEVGRCRCVSHRDNVVARPEWIANHHISEPQSQESAIV